MSSPRFRPLVISNEEVTLELSRCDSCGQGIPKYAVIRHSSNETYILFLCPICLSEYESSKVPDVESEYDVSGDETIGIRSVDENYSMESPPSKEVSIEAPADSTISTSAQSSSLDMDENWFQLFLRKTLEGKDPLVVLQELGVDSEEKLPETIMTLQTVASYPFPSVREKTVRLLIHLATKGSTKDIKAKARIALNVFSNDSDPEVQSLVQGFL